MAPPRKKSERGITRKRGVDISPAAIVAAREARDWNQTDLAKEVGVSQVTISKYESGERRPTPATLRKLAEALGVERDSLLAP